MQGEQLSAMVGELSSMGEKKSYIRPSCTQTLVDLIERVPQEVLREGVWPLLRGQLDKGWEDCTPDRLLLLLACRHRDKVGDGNSVLRTNLYTFFQYFVNPHTLSITFQHLPPKKKTCQKWLRHWRGTVHLRRLLLLLACHRRDKVGDGMETLSSGQTLYLFLNTLLIPTLWASLSGIFLQTLPELVAPLKGHSLSQPTPVSGLSP